ncbi:cytochrome-c peroxidase [Aliamphritea spongicola]
MCRNNTSAIIFLRLVCLLAAKCCRHLKHRTLQTDLFGALQLLPELTPREAAIAELGKQLFFDPRLSADNSMSCASCHQPDKGWSDGEKHHLTALVRELEGPRPGC